MSELKWYVIKAISGQENKVKTILKLKLKDLVWKRRIAGSNTNGEGNPDEKWKESSKRETLLSRLYND